MVTGELLIPFQTQINNLKSVDKSRHDEASHRELWAPFPGSGLQPPKPETNKGVHPEE